MNPLNLTPQEMEKMASKHEPFRTSEVEILQMLALQAENVISPVLQKYGLYYHVLATNEIFDQIVKNTETWCDAKRKNDEL